MGQFHPLLQGLHCGPRTVPTEGAQELSCRWAGSPELARPAGWMEGRASALHPSCHPGVSASVLMHFSRRETSSIPQIMGKYLVRVPEGAGQSAKLGCDYTQLNGKLATELSLSHSKKVRLTLKQLPFG